MHTSLLYLCAYAFSFMGFPSKIFPCRKIQSVFELSDGSGIVVTVARYETPAHIDIDKVFNLSSL